MILGFWAFAPTIAPQNSGFSLLSEEKRWDFDIYWINYHNFLTHACGSTVSRASLLLLAFRSPRGVINCNRRLYVPSHPMVGCLINGRHSSNSLSGSNPVFFSLLYKASEGNYFPFFRKDTQAFQSTSTLSLAKHSKVHSHFCKDSRRIL